MWQIPLFLIACTVLFGCSGESGTEVPPAQLLEQVGRGEFILYRLNGDRYPSEPTPDDAELMASIGEEISRLARVELVDSMR